MANGMMTVVSTKLQTTSQNNVLLTNVSHTCMHSLS